MKYVTYPNGTYTFMYPDGNVTYARHLPLYNPPTTTFPTDLWTWIFIAVVVLVVLWILIKSKP
jgi:hypothetical protein